MENEFLFSLDISIIQRGGHLSVNGAPVFRNYRDGDTHFQLPITWWLRSGVNTIEWLLYLEEDKIGPMATANAMLRMRPVGTPKDAYQSLASAGISGPLAPLSQPEGEVEVFGVGSASAQRIIPDPVRKTLTIQRDFTLNVDMPRWAWLDSPQLTDDAATRESVKAFYAYIFSLLRDGRQDALLALIQEKIREMSSAFHISPEEARRQVGLADQPKKAGWRFIPHDSEDLEVEFAADGRLVHLINERGGPAVVYTDDDGLYMLYDFWLRQDGDSWTMCR